MMGSQTNSNASRKERGNEGYKAKADLERKKYSSAAGAPDPDTLKSDVKTISASIYISA